MGLNIKNVQFSIFNPIRGYKKLTHQPPISSGAIHIKAHSGFLLQKDVCNAQALRGGTGLTSKFLKYKSRIKHLQFFSTRLSAIINQSSEIQFVC